MQRLTYAGQDITTDDAIADAVLRYAQALSIAEKSDVIYVPVLDQEGNATVAHLLIGPASQIISQPIQVVGQEQLNAGPFVAHVVQKARELGYGPATGAQLTPEHFPDFDTHIEGL